MVYVVISDAGALYDLLQDSSERIDAGSLDFDSGKVKNVVTNLSATGTSFNIETIVNMRSNAMPALDELQSRFAESYAVERHESALLLRKGTEFYTIQSNNAMMRPYVSISSDLASRPEQFAAELEDYAAVVQRALQHFAGNEMKKKYVIGVKQVPLQLDEQLQSASDEFLVTSNLSFEDIAACSEAKQRMALIYDDIVHPDRAAFYGRDPEQRYLLRGAEGVGKTMLVKALASSLEAHLGDKFRFYVADFEKLTLSPEQAALLPALFTLLQKESAVGRYRLLLLDNVHKITEEMLEQALTYFDPGDRRLTVISTTHEQQLSTMLKRQGNLGREIFVRKPTAQEMGEIYQLYIAKAAAKATRAGNNVLFADLDMPHIVTASKDFTGKMVADVMAEVLDTNAAKVLMHAHAESGVELPRDRYTPAPITTQDFLSAVQDLQTKLADQWQDRRSL